MFSGLSLSLSLESGGSVQGESRDVIQCEREGVGLNKRHRGEI